MAEAILNLNANAANVRAAFGDLVGQARNAGARLSAIDRQAANARKRLDADAARDRRRAAAQEIADQNRAANLLVKAREKSEREITAAAERGAADRGKAAARELTDQERAANRLVSVRERSERRITAALRAQVQERNRVMRAIEGAGMAGAGFALRHGAAAIGATITDIQDARQRRAATDRALNGALYQAGAGATDAVVNRRRVYQFARENRLDSADVVQGLNAAQTEFSTLGTSRSTAAERAANLENALQTSLFARDTGQSTSEVLRVQGMLANSGLDAHAQRSTLLGLTGMAQRGAIELGAVSRTAMAPMLQRIQQSLVGVDPNDAQARSHATQQAVFRTMAELEVGRSSGRTPRQVGRVTAMMADSLQGDLVQGRMLTNLRAAHLDGAINQLFATDSHGRHRLRGEYQTTAGLAQGLTAAGLTTTQMRNVFAGTGHGNAQSMQSNQRDMLAMFMGEGNENVARMMRGVGTDFTEEDVQRGHALFGTDKQSELNSDRETHDNELLENNAALNELNKTIQTFNASNPLLAHAANSIGGQSGVAAAALLSGAYSGEGRIGAGQRAERAVYEEGGVVGLFRDAMNGHARRNQLMEAETISTRAKDAEKGTVTADQVAQALARVLAQPIRVTVDPHDLAHARAADSVGSGDYTPR
jgi:hypothetical protein